MKYKLTDQAVFNMVKANEFPPNVGVHPWVDRRKAIPTVRVLSDRFRLAIVKSLQDNGLHIVFDTAEDAVQFAVTHGPLTLIDND